MNLGLILGKILYGRQAVLNYPNFSHLQAPLHSPIESLLLLKLLKGKKLFLLAKFLKFIQEENPNLVRNLIDENSANFPYENNLRTQKFEQFNKEFQYH